MRPILCSLALLPATVVAQDAAVRVEVDAPRSWVLAARQMQVEARAYTELGELVTTGFEFASSNPAVASVDASGTVTGLAPGRAEIEARGGGAAGSLTIWVHPLRIRIEPARLELEAGQSATVAARPLDADGNPVAGASFRWFSSFPGVATVEGGSVRGAGAGQATITAVLNLPDSAVSFSSQAQVVVRPRPDFRVERWHTSATNPAPLTIKAIDSFSYAGGRTAARASLSNGAQALLVHDGTQLRVLLVSGQVLEGSSREAFQINHVSVNSRGDVAATVDSDGFPSVVASFPAGRSGLSADLFSVPSISPQCCTCCAGFGPRALGSTGDLAFFAWNNGRNSLYYRRANGGVEQVSLEALPAIGAAQGVGPPNLFGALSAVFEANGAGRSGMFHWDGREVRKLIGAGDSIPEGTVTNWDSNLIADGGNFYARLGGPNFSVISRLASGVWTKLVQGEQFGSLKINGPNRLYDARNGTLLFEANTDQGTGMFRLASGTLETVAWTDSGPQGATRWPGVFQAFLTDDNRVSFLGTSGGAGASVNIASPGSVSPLIAANAGLGQNGAVMPDYRTLWAAAATGSALLARTPTSAFANFARGAAGLTLSPGDVMADGAVVQWVGGSSANRLGEAVAHVGTSTDQRILLLSEGRASLLTRAQDFRVGGSPVCCFYGQVALNNRRQWAVMTQPNGGPAQLLFVSSAGASPQTVMTTAGQPFPNEVALDDRGRVAYVADSGGRRELSIWENGQTRRVFQAGDTVGGLRLSGLGNLRAAGDRFFAIGSIEGGGNAIVETDGAGWRVVFANGTSTSFGTITNFCCSFTVNTAGDVAARVNLDFGAEAVILRKRDNRDAMIARAGTRAGNGDWLEEVREVALADTGEAYFTARSSGSARFLVYRATPQ